MSADQKTTARIQAAAENTDYPPDAFWFVLQALPRTDDRENQFPRYDARQYCRQFHDHAFRLFGQAAKLRLADWNIHSTSDFGRIVLALHRVGILPDPGPGGSEPFRDVFNFNNAFLYLIDQPSGKRFQWRLSTLFLATTLIAVIVAGARGNGIHGAVSAVAYAGFVLVGVMCMFFGLSNRIRGWIFCFFIGLLFAAIGIVGFLSTIIGIK